jgi:hypothetical protein
MVHLNIKIALNHSIFPKVVLMHGLQSSTWVEKQTLIFDSYEKSCGRLSKHTIRSCFHQFFLMLILICMHNPQKSSCAKKNIFSKKHKTCCIQSKIISLRTRQNCFESSSEVISFVSVVPKSPIWGGCRFFVLIGIRS